MQAAKYDIFLNSNGRLLDQMFGRGNAELNAQSYANKLQKTVCISADEGPMSFFYPAVSKHYKPQSALVRDWELDGWTDSDYDEMTRQAAAIRNFMVDVEDNMSSGGSFTPEMLRASIAFIQSKLERLSSIEKMYL